MRLFRRSQTRRPTWMGPLFIVAYAALTLAAFNWTTMTEGLAALWLGNGVVAAALLLLERRVAITVAFVAMVIDFSAALLIGKNSAPQSAVIALVDLGEAFAVAVLTRHACGAALDVTRLRRLIALFARAVLPATLAAGTLGAVASSVLFGAEFIPLWLAWAGGDLLGMTTALPAALLIARPDRYALSARGLGWHVALIVAIWALTALAFQQHGIHALTLIVIVAVLLATFVMGAALVAVTIIGVAFVAAGLTLAGYGPIALDHASNVGARVLHLQLSVAVVAFSSFVATALVADRVRGQRSLSRTLAAVREAHRQAQTAASTRARFLATMSHEMRTPLNGVVGRTQILSGVKGAPPEVDAQLEGIRASADALACLIDNVLDFSQLNAHELTLDLAPVDVDGIARRAGEMARELIDERPIDVTVSGIGPGHPKHLLDERRTNQILFSLVSNAVKFTTSGTISISVEVEPGEGRDLCRFRVADSGIGVDPALAQRIFEPFTQGDSSNTRQFGGAGLGLTICRSLVELMDGRIGLESHGASGSEFWVEIPAMRQEAAASVDDPADAAEPLRVLVVDDHLANLEVATAILEALGCDVECCLNGAEAVQAVDEHAYDLVFMDIHMPVMDGLEACRAIRDLPHAGGRTPIVALTAAATAKDVSACLGVGMNAHLSKPIRADRLADAVIRYATWRGEGAPAAA